MKSQNRSVVASWLIPSAVLMAVVMAMLFHFSTISSADAEESVSRSLIRSVQEYGDDFIHELELLEKAAEPMCALMEREADRNEREDADLAEILASSTDACKVIVCDDAGKGVDQRRAAVAIGEEEYFQSVRALEGTACLYIEDQGADGTSPAPVVAVAKRVATADGKRYLFLFYPMEKFDDLLSRADFDSASFLALIDPQGKVMGAAGAKNSKMIAGGNLLEAIREENPDAVKTIGNRLGNGARGTTGVTVGGEDCMLAYAPLGVNGWEIVLGVSQDYVDRQVRLLWQSTKSMLTSLILVISAFLCLVAAINIVGRIRNHDKEKELEDKADTDLLTGLTNKLATERKIKAFMAQNPNTQSMMFMVDIDNFKKINDTMGHAFGDEVLRSFGQQIGTLFRASDIIGRIGGDEFMIFLKGVSDKEAIRKEARKVEYFFENFQAGEYVKYDATASVGVAVFPQEGADFESLYKAADQGVYKAKKRGKNQLAFYRDEWMQEEEKEEESRPMQAADRV